MVLIPPGGSPSTRTRAESARTHGSRLFFMRCGGRLPAERDGEDKNEKQRESPGARDVRDAGRPLGALKLNVAGSTIRAKPSNCRVDRTVGSEGLRIEWKVGPRNPDETFEIPCRRTSGSTPVFTSFAGFRARRRLRKFGEIRNLRKPIRGFTISRRTISFFDVHRRKNVDIESKFEGVELVKDAFRNLFRNRIRK